MVDFARDVAGILGLAAVLTVPLAVTLRAFAGAFVTGFTALTDLRLAGLAGEIMAPQTSVIAESVERLICRVDLARRRLNGSCI
ncbi:hypothetical protein [Oceaniovalibus sp. ACAM 378]|uniref:hypothetical protein n=1 Tax=Oceaniovalibus sp. ACAM 378 TaxID=2599923 RepID=UPI0021062D0B|nr:hypothetical protein [Oceaniovalibus sp. ACAM 378]